eukprot:1190278-Prorocentrum_minimum.AAC.4
MRSFRNIHASPVHHNKEQTRASSVVGKGVTTSVDSCPNRRNWETQACTSERCSKLVPSYHPKFSDEEGNTALAYCARPQRLAGRARESRTKHPKHRSFSKAARQSLVLGRTNLRDQCPND